jgi:hypothetical protein
MGVLRKITFIAESTYLDAVLNRLGVAGPELFGTFFLSGKTDYSGRIWPETEPFLGDANRLASVVT